MLPGTWPKPYFGGHSSKHLRLWHASQYMFDGYLKSYA